MKLLKILSEMFSNDYINSASCPALHAIFMSEPIYSLESHIF